LLLLGIGSVDADDDGAEIRKDLAVPELPPVCLNDAAPSWSGALLILTRVTECTLDVLLLFDRRGGESFGPRQYPVCFGHRRAGSNLALVQQPFQQFPVFIYTTRILPDRGNAMTMGVVFHRDHQMNIASAIFEQGPGRVEFVRPLLDIDDGVTSQTVETVRHDLTKPEVG